jgi:hypothetical protein
MLSMLCDCYYQLLHIDTAKKGLLSACLSAHAYLYHEGSCTLACAQVLPTHAQYLHINSLPVLAVPVSADPPCASSVAMFHGTHKLYTHPLVLEVATIAVL